MLLARWLKFNAVGATGIVVQLAVLALLKSGLGLNYLIATAIAVEIAVLNNFYWHVRWTWADRHAPLSETLKRCLKFHLANGLLSIVSNLILMRLLVGRFGVPYLVANLIAIGLTAVANFVASEFFVFRHHKQHSPPETEPQP